VYHALHRLLAPRHPPYALRSFALRDSEKLKFSALLDYSLGKVLASSRWTGSVSTRRVSDPPLPWKSPSRPPADRSPALNDNSPASRRAVPFPSSCFAVYDVVVCLIINSTCTLFVNP
jgi:hypothetical protein